MNFQGLGKLFAAFLTLLLGAGVNTTFGQNPPAEAASKAQAKPTTRDQDVSDKDGRRLKLLDATRVSTDATAKSATKDEARKTNADGTENSGDNSTILEFHPGDVMQTGKAVVVPEESGKNGKAQNVHGDAYGVLGASDTGTHSAGGSVGVSTKSKKTSVYVESSRSASDQRH